MKNLGDGWRIEEHRRNNWELALKGAVCKILVTVIYSINHAGILPGKQMIWLLYKWTPASICEGRVWFKCLTLCCCNSVFFFHIVMSDDVMICNGIMIYHRAHFVPYSSRIHLQLVFHPIGFQWQSETLPVPLVRKNMTGIHTVEWIEMVHYCFKCLIHTDNHPFWGILSNGPKFNLEGWAGILLVPIRYEAPSMITLLRFFFLIQLL